MDLASVQAEIAKVKEDLVKRKKENPKWKEDEEVMAVVKKLKSLIAEEKKITKEGKEKEKGKATAAPAKKEKKKGGDAAAAGAGGKAGGAKHELAIAYQKGKHLGEWYHDVIFKSEMVDNYPVSGCYILRPWSFSIWESIQTFFDAGIKKKGVKNAYFPMFVSEDALMREKDHIEGFAPEVAWITKYSDTTLQKPIAVRPTSETIIYPAYREWIRSHRDLPIQLNQWCNVVRWEFKSPMPFIRTREFLWQEGHSAFATKQAAIDEVLDILDLYARTYQDLLAVPVIKGKKSEKEKFAGGDFTTTVEVYCPVVGRGIQAATSHHLGQNFSKMFDITFEGQADESSKKPAAAAATSGKENLNYVYQNSWGLSTRSIGTMVLVHGDDKGLVLPPRAAPIQCVFIVIQFKDGKYSNDQMAAQSQELIDTMSQAGLRCRLDDRVGHNSGFLRNHWELKGVPLRMEIGPKDMDKQSVLVCRRDTGEKISVPWVDLVPRTIELLEEIQETLFKRAKKERDEHISRCNTWKEFMAAMDKRHFALSPWCNEIDCEEAIKKKSAEDAQAEADKERENDEEDFEKLTAAAKTLCIPFPGQLDDELMKLDDQQKCVKCDKAAQVVCLFGRSY